MTNGQRKVLAHIVHCYKQGGPLPSGQELMDQFDWGSSRTAQDYFMALEDCGAIRRKNGAKRYGLVTSHVEVQRMLGIRGPRGRYICGSCGGEGHNIRTCRGAV